MLHAAPRISGTFALVVFALLEVIIFAWVFGMDRGWAEITRGADMRVPGFFRFVIRWITPLFISVVFVGALFQPMGPGWGAAFWKLFSGEGWPFAPESVIGRVLHVGDASYAWLDAAGVPTRAMVQDFTRLLLLGVFLGARRPGLVRLAPQRSGARTAAAWWMLAATWAVVIFFTARFFLAVLRTPPRSDGEA